MKKKIIRLLGFITIIGAFYFFILYPTGWLVYSTNSSTANDPGIKIDDCAISSNLVTPNILDFVVFSYKDSLFGKYDKVFRLVGKEGDTVQIIEGVLFRNGKNVDKDLALKYGYEIPVENVNQLRDDDLFDEDLDVLIVFDSMYSLFAEKNSGIIKKFNLKRRMDSLNYEDDIIFKKYGKSWNKDYFGPIVIPEGKFFVLGDNRDNAEDSRYIGLIDKGDLKGVILKVF